MQIERFITASRIIEIESSDLSGALSELLDVCEIGELETYGKRKLLKELLDREHTITTNLGNGVALPHVRVPMKRRYIMAMGRCPQGLTHEGSDDYKDVKLVLLLLASENARNYLNALAAIAGIFQDKTVVERLMEQAALLDFKTEVKRTLSGDPQKPRSKPTRINRLVLKESEKIATSARCKSVLIFGDTFAGGVELSQSFKNLRTVLVTQAGSETVEETNAVSDYLPIRSFSNHRMSQLRSAILIGLTRGIFQPDELICCVGGLPQSNRFDTILVVDVAREFRTLFSERSHTLPPSLRPEVMERVLAIAMELGLEGREGKKVGCLFVLGDTNKVLEFSKPLVLNPFYGYREEDRNVLNPFMDETVKEFSSIDGAFIIRGNGVIEAAGTLLRTSDSPDLPGGLGARHAAAAAVTKSTRSLAIAVSESTGQVTLFSNGDMISLLGYPVGGNF
ncbi:MAG: diadenylate cyclase [Verrucomicrobiota bacterium]